MIKKILTMSAGIVLGCMMTTASFADPGHGNDCHDARADEGDVIGVIQDCKDTAPRGPWICDVPSRATATECKNACKAVRQALCATPPIVPAAADVAKCDACLDDNDTDGTRNMEDTDWVPFD
jgi:hypothetical protein